MRKYKVVVYAICKNEEKFIKRWVDSMSEADEIYVLDTGSSDDSVKVLKECGVHVSKEVIVPWRFDVARNKSLDLVPLDADICVCTDIDEVFNTGWRDKLEEIWNGSRVSYNYNWVINDDEEVLVSYYLNKIHKREGYVWRYPVHEVLECLSDESVITTDEIVLNHFPDKNKSRSSYLSLLELAYLEEPDNPRILHYLGREYMYYDENDKAIEFFEKHLNSNSSWHEERCASMRFMARCYYRKGDIDSCLKWYDAAIKEASWLRDPLVEKAFVLFDKKKYNEVIYLCNVALDIKYNKKEYINEVFSYDGSIEDLLSLCYYYKGDKRLALYYVREAIKLRPNDKRLADNEKFFK